MATASTIREPNLPWAEGPEDRSFRWIVIIMLLVFVSCGIVLNGIKLPEIVEKNLVDVSPRLAKLIMEKKKVKPPPKKIKPKPKPKKKKEPEKKKKEKKKEVKKASAREVAKQSGLIALSDELADLRESFALDDVLGNQSAQQITGKQAAKQTVVVASANELLSSTATQSSGGIKTDTLNRTIQTSELTQRKTTQVESKIETNQTKLAKLAKAETVAKTASGGSKSAALDRRSEAEIERVFQQNRGSIFNIYQRALRKNPSLVGKVVVELTISPQGQVTTARIVSSELGDKALERKLVLKIRKFKFTSANVAEVTVTYPIDFLPS